MIGRIGSKAGAKRAIAATLRQADPAWSHLEENREGGVSMAINRRDLLVRGGTAAALGAGGLGSFASAQAQQPPIQWQREADVVIIGSGAAGLPAAIVAKDAGYWVHV